MVTFFGDTMIKRRYFRIDGLYGYYENTTALNCDELLIRMMIGIGKTPIVYTSPTIIII
jgi:hypothetical protein